MIEIESQLKWYSERKSIMMRAIGHVLNSKDHESAIKAARDALDELEQHYSPFSPDEPEKVNKEATAA